MKVWTRLLAMTLSLGMILAVQTVRADYSFNYTDKDGISFAGTLQTTPLTSAPYSGLELATGGNITITGSALFTALNGVGPIPISFSGGPSPIYQNQHGSFSYDNLVFPAGNSSIDPNHTGVTGTGYLDNDGLWFNGKFNYSVEVNHIPFKQAATLYCLLYFNGSYEDAYWVVNDGNPTPVAQYQSAGVGATLTLSPQATPEPSSYALMLIGSCCVAFHFYRRRMAVIV